MAHSANSAAVSAPFSGSFGKSSITICIALCKSNANALFGSVGKSQAIQIVDSDRIQCSIQEAVVFTFERSKLSSIRGSIWNTLQAADTKADIHSYSKAESIGSTATYQPANKVAD
jgi:hypothetical protein